MAQYTFGRGEAPDGAQEHPDEASSAFGADQPLNIGELFEPENPLVQKVSLAVADTIDRIPADDGLTSSSVARALAPGIAQLLSDSYVQGKKDATTTNQR